MSMAMRARRLLPRSLKNWVRKLSSSSRMVAQISPYLPALVCVDVGASYYPHTKWRVFLESPKTHWIAVEPNPDNLGYVQSWAWPCTVAVVPTGLSQHGGPQTLFVTNVDSGSSLLEPAIPDSMSHRVWNLDYFFPVREKRVDTLTLAQVLAETHAGTPVFVKLDTQGTELSILAGAQSRLADRSVVGIEMESTLLAQPIMQGAGKFWQACEYLEGFGFELLYVKPIHAAARSGNSKRSGLAYLNECDAVFAIRRDIAKGLAVDCRVALLGFYCSYALFEEGLSLLADVEVNSWLERRGCDVCALDKTLRALA